MDLFTRLFGDLLAFVYHCFDRIVIHGYLTGLSRPEHVVHFFREVGGAPVISKEILSERTHRYQSWVEAFARNHGIPIEWAEKGVRKEDFVLRWQRRMVRKNAYGVYFILKSMELGPTFRISAPKYPTQDPNYRIIAHQRSRFTHYYFYIRDQTLGPIVMRIGSFLPFQATYFTVIDQVEHGHHVFRAYFRNAVLRQYEKFSILAQRTLFQQPLRLRSQEGTGSSG